MISEILFRAAGEDIEKRKLAGLIAVSTDWCWPEFMAIKSKERKWAIKTLAAAVTIGDGAPEILTKRKEKL